MTAHTDVQEFFDSYRRAFESLDAMAIGEFFAFPCQVTSDAQEVAVLAVASRDVWAPVLDGLVGAYRTIGVRSAEMLDTRVFQLTPRLKQTSIRWRVVDDEGRPIYEFDCSYTLANFGSGLRITAIAHNEGSRLREQAERRQPR